MPLRRSILLTSAFCVLSSLLLSAQTDLVSDPSTVFINPRRALAFGAAVVSVLLVLQYAHRRKPFILVWAAAWLLITPAMLLVARGYSNLAIEREAVGLSQPRCRSSAG